MSKVVVKQSSAYQHKKEELSSEQKELETLKQTLEEAQYALNTYFQNEKDAKTDLELKQKEFEELSTSLNNFSNQLHSINAGIASSGSGKTLTEQLMEFKKISVNASTEIKQCALNITHLTKELAEKEKSLAQVGNEHVQLTKKFEKSEQELKTLEEKINNSNFNEKKYKEKIQEKEKVESLISSLKNEISILSSKLSRFDFNYKEPEKNFDASSVKGKVASLFEMKTEGTARALEVAAGAKLYNVVIKDEKTGQKLIEKKSLNERVSFIPLNKIQSEVTSSSICQKAKQVAGKGNADLALSLIDYNQDVQKAMEYVFGNTFVCDSLDTAETVAFHKDIKKKTVTLKGDSFDPSGSLTGGSRGNSEAALETLETLKAKKQELLTLQNTLKNIVSSIELMQQFKSEFQKLNSEYQLKKHECEILSSKIKEGKRSQLLEECETITKDIKLQQEKQSKAEELKKEKDSACKQIEHDMNHFTDHKDAQKKQIEVLITLFLTHV
jgi:structural maintenance of chromosome 2